MVVHLVLRRPVPVPAPQIRVVWQGFRTGDTPEARWTDGTGQAHRWSGTRGVPWLLRDALREGEEWKVNLLGVPADVPAVSLFLSSPVGRTVGVMVQPLSGDPNAAVLHPGAVLTPGTAVEILEFHRTGPGWQVVALTIAESTDPANDVPSAVPPTPVPPAPVQPPGVPVAPSSTPGPAASGPGPGAPGTFGGWSGPVTDAPAPRHRADDDAVASASAAAAPAGWGPPPAAPGAPGATGATGATGGRPAPPAAAPPGPGHQPPVVPDDRTVQVPTPAPWPAPLPSAPSPAPPSTPAAGSTATAATSRWDRSTATEDLDQGPQVPIPDRLAGAVDAARSTGAVRQARVTAVVDLSASMYPWIASGVLADVLTATQAVAGAAQRPSLSTRFLPDGTDLELTLDAEPAGKLQEQLRAVGLRTGDRGRLVRALTGSGGSGAGSAGGTDTVTLVVTDDASLAAQAGPGTTAVIVGADPGDRSIGGDHAVAVADGPVDVPRLARELAQRCFTTARR